MTVTLAVVTAGLSQPSATRLLADRLTAAVTRQLADRGLDVLVEVVELRPLAHALADNLLTGFPSAELEAALTTVVSADGVIAVTPVFTASYSGLFKMFFDVLDSDALAGTPTLIAATAGTARHSLVLEHALRPLFAYLRAVVVPTGVFAATEDFGASGSAVSGSAVSGSAVSGSAVSGSAGAAGESLGERVDRAAAELAGLLVPSSPRAATPSADPFDDVPPFEELLRGR